MSENELRLTLTDEDGHLLDAVTLTRDELESAQMYGVIALELVGRLRAGEAEEA